MPERSIKPTLYGPISLGSLIDALKRCEPDKLVRFDFCFFSPGTLNSDRGDYSQLAVAPVEEPRTVREILAECEKAVGARFEGWKGGSYEMNRETPVWVGPYGESAGTAIVDVRDLSWITILDTELIDR